MFQNSESVRRFLTEEYNRCAVLVVGDCMLDQYYFSEVRRISPEAPVPVARVVEERQTLGGAANVAKNLALLGCKVLVTGIAGLDSNQQRLCQLMNQAGIDYSGLILTDRPTTAKMRIIGGHQQMLRLDFEDASPVSRRTEQELKKAISQALQQGVRVAIISDYAKGVCTRNICQHIVKEAAALSIAVIIDPKGPDWKKYSGAGYITPNLKELSEAMKTRLPNEDRAVWQAADKARKRFNINSVIVTRSEKGLSLVDDREARHMPTQAKEVFDVSGAGDTVIAVLGAALAARVPPAEAAFLANLAAGVVVGKLGTYAISREELLQAAAPYLPPGREPQAPAINREVG